MNSATNRKKVFTKSKQKEKKNHKQKRATKRINQWTAKTKTKNIGAFNILEELVDNFARIKKKDRKKRKNQILTKIRSN